MLSVTTATGPGGSTSHPLGCKPAMSPLFVRCRRPVGRGQMRRPRREPTACSADQLLHRAAAIVSRNVSSASCRGRQRSSRRAFAVSMITGSRKALIHCAWAGRKPSAADHLGDRVDGELGHRDRVPAELLRELLDGQLTGAGEVVDARRRRARARPRASPLATSSWWTSWNGTPGSGSTGLRIGTPLEQARTGRGSRSDSCVYGRLSISIGASRPGDDARPQHVRVGRAARSVSRQQRLDLGLLGRVVVARRCRAPARPRSAAGGCRRGSRTPRPTMHRRAA